MERDDMMPRLKPQPAREAKLAATQSEWDGIIKARKLFFEAERALAKAGLEYEKARIQYERACSQVGVSPHYAP
jgi:hypothetical protein